MATVQTEKAAKYQWNCPNCGTADTTTLRHCDLVTCKKCQRTNLAFTVTFTEVEK